jgi:hypothetical protein
MDYALRGVAPTALRSISCDAFAAGAKTPRRQAPAANATRPLMHCVLLDLRVTAGQNGKPDP